MSKSGDGPDMWNVNLITMITMITMLSNDNNAIKTLEHYKIINIDATLALNETRTVF